MTSITELSQQINSRIIEGQPFTSPATAWQGCETLTTVEGITISLSYTTCDKTLRVRATTQTEFVGSIEAAQRVGRGQYEPKASQPEIEQWLADVTGQGQAESPANGNGESKSLLDLALAEFASRTQWSSSDNITIWQNGSKAAWLSRNSQGFITLQLFKDAGRLTDRKYSKPLAIGYYSPSDKMFVESHSVRDDYSQWANEARRAVA